MISTVPHLTPLYSDDPDALDDARDLLVANSRAAIPEWLKKHPPLAADLRALVASGKPRPCRHAVALKVVFIDKSGRGDGRLGELLMEQIADETATGELYPAASMAGVCTDAPWDGALSAFWYARDCGFGIAPGTDVRWSVRVLPQGRNWDEHKDELCLPKILTGRSAGVAFFLGLFALAQAKGALGGWKAREVVERMVALATLPDTEARAAVDPLGTLGGEETKKLAALAALPAGTRVVVVFPAAFTGSIHGRHESLAVTTVGGLAAALRERCAGATRPDSLPASRHASFYIGGSDEVRVLTELLRKGGFHVVSGSGGVGKTARVVEASEPLWKEGVFPGGRFWIDLYGARESGRTPDVLAAERIVKTCRERPAEKLDDLRAQARDLLARHPSLIFLEGAETVAEGDIAPLLELFPEPTTVVWMTRRETDAQHACLRSATNHLVRALSAADALELLCYAAGCKVEELPTTEREDWEEIARATENLPLLLGWAGEALRPDRSSNAAQYLAELRADPLGEIADPNARERNNAGRFLRRSLARIAPTAEMPDLPTVAERLFAGLAVFHPSYGAPLAWWPMAAGLDVTKSAGRRRFAAARRALLGLGLVTAEALPPGASAVTETLHAIHALAGVVAAELWRGQPVEQRRAALDALCHAATTALEKPLAPQWFCDAAWVAGRSAEAVHYGHWLGEIEALPSHADPVRLTPGAKSIAVDWFPADSLRRAWVEFLQEHAEPQPLLALKGNAWMAVGRHLQQLAAANPDVPEFLYGLASSWERLGDVRKECHDWTGVEEASQKAIAISKKLAATYPDDPDFQSGLAASWTSLGDVRVVRQDWVGAETAFDAAMAIRKKLAEAHPGLEEFQNALAVSWARLGDVRIGRKDCAGAETAFNAAMTIDKKLGEAHPEDPDCQRNLSLSLTRLGDVRVERQDWAGAKEAFNAALEIREKLVASHPDVPDYQRLLFVSWNRLGYVCVKRRGWASAEKAFNAAMAISKKLAFAYPDVPDFQNGLAASWASLGDVCVERQDWAGAETAFTAAMTISKKLAEACPDVPNFQLNLSVSWERLGSVQKARQDWAGAEEAFKAVMPIRKKLAEAYPDVPDFQFRLAAAFASLGDIRVERQDLAGAETAFKAAMAIDRNLVETYPEVTDFQSGLAFSSQRLAALAVKRATMRRRNRR